MDEFKCGEKHVAQTYDRVAVMAGEHNGLKSLLKGKHNHAMFLYCYTNKLNLVLEQSVNHIKECKVFFQTVSGLFAFLSMSSKRTNTLDFDVKTCLTTASSTRWNYKSRMIDVIFHL
jgi:hypothetical protein